MKLQIRNFFYNIRIKPKKKQTDSSSNFLSKNQIIEKLIDLMKEDKIEEVINAKKEEDKKNLEIKYSLEASRTLTKLYELGFTKSQISSIISYATDFTTIKHIIYYLPKAAVLNLTHFTPDTITTAVIKGWKIEILFEIAQKFEQHSLEEEDKDFANFNILLSSNINDKTALEIVDTLIQSKYKEIEIKQRDIIRYLNSIQGEIEEPVKNLYLGLYLSKEKNLELNINDFITGVSFGKPPKMLAITYSRIKENDLAINKQRYITLPISQSLIDKIVNYMILAKKYNIFLDLEDIVKQYSLGSNVFDVLRILIKLQEAGFKEIEFNYITKLLRLGVDINTILPAFKYAKKNLDVKEFIKDIDRVLPIKKETDDKETNFNLVNFARAIDIATNTFNIDKETIIADFTAGIDVWSIIDLINYSKSKGKEINYIIAKIIAKNGLDALKDVIYKTLNPFEIESDYIHVTTKDNIEIKVKLIVLVTYNINNFFKGTDEKYLLRRVKALFIDEVQKKYNHDEIIKNIEIISRNIILRLRGNIPEEDKKILELDKLLEEEQREKSFNKVSKYEAIKILIPQIEFVKDSFKEIDKLKQIHEAEREKIRLELEKLKAEIKIREAWANSKDLKYLILRDEDIFRETKRFHQDKDIEEDSPEKD